MHAFFQNTNDCLCLHPFKIRTNLISWESRMMYINARNSEFFCKVICRLVDYIAEMSRARTGSLTVGKNRSYHKLYVIQGTFKAEGGGGSRELGLRDLAALRSQTFAISSYDFYRHKTVELRYATLCYVMHYGMLYEYATHYAIQYYYWFRYIVVELCDASLSSEAHTTYMYTTMGRSMSMR